MPSLKPIDDYSVHQICAGQVITDLKSVAKELCENSIDSGAKSINIKFWRSGLEGIEVADDGHGISQVDLKYLGRNHFTSKISKFDDIMSCSSLGFRGEALASLCTIANVEIVTATEESQPVAFKVHPNRLGADPLIEKSTRNRGTTVLINNLFEQLPVRRRELEKNIKREYQKVILALQQYAIINEQISINVSNQTSSSKPRSFQIQTPTMSKLRDKILVVYGSKQAQNLIDVNLSLEQFDGSLVKPIKLQGCISNPVLPSSKVSGPPSQLLYINRRPVQIPKVTKVLQKIFKQYSFQSSPFFVLILKISPDQYDINVSPDKRTVFLHDEIKIIECLRRAFTNLLESIELPINNSQFLNAPKNIKDSSSLDCRNSPKIDTNGGEIEKLASSFEQPTEQNHFLRKTKINRENSVAPVVDSTLPPESSINLKSSQAPSVFSRAASQVSISSTTETASSPNHNLNEKKMLNSSFPNSKSFPSDATVTAARRESSENIAQLDQPTESLAVSRKRENESTEPTELEMFARRSQHSRLERFDLTNATYDAALSARNKNSKSDITNSQISLDQLENEEIDLNRNKATESSSGCTKNKEVSTARIENGNTHLEGLEIDDPSLQREKKIMRLEVESQKLSEYAKSSDILNNRISRAIDAAREDSNGLYKSKVHVLLDSATLCSSAKCLSSSFKAENEYTWHSQMDAVNNIEDQKAAENLTVIIKKSMFGEMNVVGQFNMGFILVTSQKGRAEKGNLFIIDQHASDEKFNYEMLRSNTVISSQRLVNERRLNLTVPAEMVAIDHLDLLKRNGFELAIDESKSPGQRCSLIAQPMSKNTMFDHNDLNELLSKIQENPNGLIQCSKVERMLASRACRSSIMIGTSLTEPIMRRVVRNLGRLDKPWNCPHGRPTMRHLAQLDQYKSWSNDLKIKMDLDTVHQI